LNNFVRYLIITSTLLLMVVVGCRKETIFQTKDALLQFSADTVYLDTVFTTIGSSTRLLKVYNNTSDNLIISRVYLGNGQSSFFRMNVNGESGREIKNVEIRANDSIYVFIEVTTDVMGANTLLYTDSILFETGKNQQHVNLVTLAKDAHFYYPNRILTINQPAPFPPIEIPYSILPCNAIFGTDKPHVIYGYVVVDSTCTLNVLAGAEVHFHSGSGLWVYRGGKLLVDEAEQGNFENPVTFQGDRLEPNYRNIPGQWGGLLGGIFIQSGSEGNIINNAIIKNATNALRVDSTSSSNPNLRIKNVQILNNSRVGLYGGYANIDAQNLIIGNGGLYLFYALGGTYTFRHCTFANFWVSSSRNTSAVGLFNFFEDGNGNRFYRALNQAYFGNCIIYGSAQSEVALGIGAGADFNYFFNHALLRINENPDAKHYDVNDATYFNNVILNQNPRFEDVQNNLYALDSISPALNMGNNNDAQLVPFDIKGTSRLTNPDLGAIER